MPRILLEGDTFEFLPDRAALAESVRTGQVYKQPIPGRFSVCDSVNGNNRRYPKRVWEKNLAPDSPLLDAITKNRSLGLLEHPKDGQVDLRSPISHVVTKAFLKENEVHGEVRLINTAEGHKMGALIEAGYNPLVSSRGYGSVVRGTDGIDEVQDDFVCESWDFVLHPSFKTAELTPQRESAPVIAPASVTNESRGIASFTTVNALIENGTITTATPGHRMVARLVGEKVIVESTPVSAPSATPAITHHKTPTMDIKQIREGVSALRAIDVSKLDPKRLAEGLLKARELHTETSAAVAQDPKLSWDGGQVHEELSQFERTACEAMTAPAATVTKLQEQQLRTFKILKETAGLGVKFKTALAEALKKATHTGKVNEELARRGNSWRKRAQVAEGKLNLSESRLNLAYASLDEFTRRYHEDTTKLARHALMLEHKAKIEADAALLKRVNEAKTVAELGTIKESITGTTAPVVTPAAPGTAPVVTPPATTPVAAAAVTPAPKVESMPTVQVSSTQRKFTVSEVIASSKRLSEASATSLNG